MKRFISILLIFYFLSSAAIAGKEGMDADKKNAVIEYHKAAVQGHANAQNTLGVMHEKSRDVRHTLQSFD